RFAEHPGLLEVMRRCLEEKIVIQREVTNRDKLFNVTFAPVPPDVVMVHSEEITERKRTENALRQSERFNRNIIESSSDCIKILDLEGKLLFINQKGLDLLETNSDSCIGRRWLALWGETERDALRLEIVRAKAGGTGRY